MTSLDGHLIREHLKQECQKYKSILQSSEKEVSIVRFEAPEDITPKQKAKYESARISAEQKVDTFCSIGINAKQIILSSDIDTEQFDSIIESINENTKVIAAIVQNPTPPKFVNSIKLLDPQKDIDVVRKESNNFFQSCATAEGIARMVKSYAQKDSIVAVVGGEGFVGNGVIKYLEVNKISCFCLERNNDLNRIKEADIVVSVTGKLGILTPYILPSHRLVIDAGFTPTPEGAKGDVDRCAYDIPQNITPVPGGMGPIEMGILIERVVKMELGIELPKWNYQLLQHEQGKLAVTIAPIAKELFHQQATAYPESIQTEKENLSVLEGSKYKLSFNNAEQTLTLTRANEKLKLIELNITNNQIKIARGLTSEDVRNWQAIRELSQSKPRRTEDRGIEL